MVVTIKQIAERKGITYRAVKKRRDKEGWFSEKTVKVNHTKAEAFHVNALPSDLQSLFSINAGQFSINAIENEVDMEQYSSAPKWARRKADKYLRILRACEGLKGKALRIFVDEWNDKYPELRTSYPRVITARRMFRQQGISGLLAKYGKSSGQSKVKDEWFDYFKAVYLVEGAPSLKSCWIMTMGYATGRDPHVTVNTFPSQKTFLRRLERDVPRQAVYMARHGRKAWNSRFNNYVERDYLNLKPGECYVSDHAQVDVAVMLPGGKICFPWVTAWRDFKSGKWLGWLFNPEPPNSDHVFQSFYYAVRDYGLPTDVYIDNGKDYRTKDFAGGRRHHKVRINEERTISMLTLLDITPHFSLPYNPQSKAIERDFLRNKEWFSKHMRGYRGGHIKERPEKLAREIKRGLILKWAEFVEFMDSFIADVLNKMPSNGKVLRGMSPDMVWEKERIEERRISRDALKLFCMRTSRPLTVGRNGVRDSEIGVTYWAEWMSGIKGEKVYLRRDIKSYQEAWVFRAKDDEFLGKAYIAERAAALARTDLEKAQLKTLLTRKREVEKITKAFAKIKDLPSPSEALSHLKAGVSALNGNKSSTARKNKISVSSKKSTMDIVLRIYEETLSEGLMDLRRIQPPEREAEKLYLYETDRIAVENERGYQDE